MGEGTIEERVFRRFVKTVSGVDCIYVICLFITHSLTFCLQVRFVLSIARDIAIYRYRFAYFFAILPISKVWLSNVQRRYKSDYQAATHE